MAKKEREVLTINILDSAGSTTIPVLVTNAIVYTKAFRIDDAVAANVDVVIGLAAATGSANITGVIEQSFELPTIEGSAHPSYITINTIMNTFSTVSTHTHATITLYGMKYARCKFTAAAPNTSASVTVKFSKQVEG